MLDKKKLYEIRAEKERWEKKHQEYFEKEKKKEFFTSDGIPVKRVYTPLDLEEKNFDYLRDLGFPGEYPFTRDATPSGYRERPYAVRQQFGASTVEETNRLNREMMATIGQEQMFISSDLPTKFGYDSDDPRVAGDVGRAGLAIDSLEDTMILTEGIDLSKSTMLFTCIPATAMILALFIAAAEKQGVPLEKQSFHPQNDILQAHIAFDEYIFPVKYGLRLAVDAGSFIAQYMPRSKAFRVCSYHISEAGANRIQEVAIALSAALTYVRAVVKRGIDIDLIAPRMGVQGILRYRGLLDEIAKTRAIRRIWARIMREEFEAKNPESWAIEVHTGTGGTDLTQDEMGMNILRSGIATLGAALAGVKAVTGCTYDEPLGIPSRYAIETGIKSRHLIAYEVGVTDTVDPLAGSYYIEYMTTEIEQRVREYMSRIEVAGGMIAAVENRWLTNDIALNAHKIAKQTESGERIVIGLNKFVSEQSKERLVPYKPIITREFGKTLEIQVDKLKRLRKTRDNKRVEKCLEDIRAVAARGESKDNNLMFPILEAARVYATLGEITGALKDVFGVAK
jgi:methylmalonyl-CoA mutase N-terminal domain/subunit